MNKQFGRTCCGRWCVALLWSFLVLGLCLSWAQAATDYLEPDAAFQFSAKMLDKNTIAVKYLIADGYYLYREPFRFQANGAKLGTPSIPAGHIKFDNTFQKEVETYRKEITLTIPVEAAGSFDLSVTAQGCADQGLCYPPMTTKISLPQKNKGLLASLGIGKGVEQDSVAQINTATAAVSIPGPIDSVSTAGVNVKSGSSSVVDALPANELTRIETSLRSGKLWVILPLFLLLGLGLAFTPCVLPMLPILSSLIVGADRQSSTVDGQRTRHFGLAVSYSLGMALVYTALGIAAGLAGEGLAASLQNPWVLSGFALLMVLLALSMFGFYQLQLPASWQTRLSQASAHQRSGQLAGVFVMGALSALIVGPCVAAPLAGALVYIGQTGDVVLGGAALFTMALGMSVPLLLIGLSAHSILPRAGAWMEQVKYFFGVMLLGLAWWMVASLVPVIVQMVGWALLGIAYGAYLLWRPAMAWPVRALGILVTALGLLQLVGASSGARLITAPLAQLGGASVAPLAFTRVESNEALNAALLRANGRITVVDFYADWCVSCKEMEQTTYVDPQVRARLANMQLLQVDVTANNAEQRALLKRFGLFGPPGILFFDTQASELKSARVVGYQDAAAFQSSLQRVALQSNR